MTENKSIPILLIFSSILILTSINVNGFFDSLDSEDYSYNDCCDGYQISLVYHNVTDFLTLTSQVGCSCAAKTIDFPSNNCKIRFLAKGDEPTACIAIDGLCVTYFSANSSSEMQLYESDFTVNKRRADLVFYSHYPDTSDFATSSFDSLEIVCGNQEFTYVYNESLFEINTSEEILVNNDLGINTTIDLNGADSKINNVNVKDFSTIKSESEIVNNNPIPPWKVFSVIFVIILFIYLFLRDDRLRKFKNPDDKNIMSDVELILLAILKSMGIALFFTFIALFWWWLPAFMLISFTDGNTNILSWIYSMNGFFTVILVISIFLILFYADKSINDRKKYLIIKKQNQKLKTYRSKKIKKTLKNKKFVSVKLKDKQILPVILKNSSVKTEKNIKLFFESLLLNKIMPLKDFKKGPYLDDANYKLFESFIYNTKKTLNIITNRFDAKLLAKLLLPLNKTNIKIRIITRQIINEKYFESFDKYLDLNVICKKVHKNHSKYMIRDDETMLIGSSNITNASMNQYSHFYDANIVTGDVKSISEAKTVFESIWTNDNKLKHYKGSNFAYSRKGNNYLPLLLKKYFKNETEEITIVMSLSLIDWQILELIENWNSTIKIKLVIGNKWFSNDTYSKDDIYTMQRLINLFKNKGGNIEVIPKRMNIHAKLYLFRGQKISIFSSQNLTISSWFSMLESAYIHGRDFTRINSHIEKLPNGNLNNLPNLIEVAKPKSTWQGTQSEKYKGIPWSLAEADSNLKHFKKDTTSYYKLEKKEIKRNINTLDLPKGERQKSITKKELKELKANLYDLADDLWEQGRHEEANKVYKQIDVIQRKIDKGEKVHHTDYIDFKYY